jgi:eukaryotic-like serine/threonine-protein kinase
LFACPTCATPVAGSEPACPACGSDLDIAESPTGTAPHPAAPGTPSSGEKPRTPTNGAGRLAGERFVPGAVLAGRYRIVGLIGRGGMGEVYRADDLKLEQPVALKFLPHGLDADGERLARFYREVRVARQVSHAAVCRVYDVAEAEGHFFLSMELVDGENLASLLRRIGRLPPDKALEIARQLCAGLAAAHERGVLHRDLKPANVMLDGQGNVRITDFGLAGLAESLRHQDVRSGTPSYMSPEQLLGREVTVRSDIYALGLVLYELYTGRRAFEGKSLAEYARKHRDERPIEPSALVAGLDPAVERAILSCLEKEPRRRPASPLVVSAMLTGRDPLEAALAAGETPSPEIVAAAGETHGLRPASAWGLLGIALVGFALVPATGVTFRMLEKVPAGKAPAALEDRARDFVRRVVPEATAVDDTWGLGAEWGYPGYVAEKDPSPGRWSDLASGELPVLEFWYRQSPRPLVSLQPSGKVYWSKPGLDVTGMAGVTYDMEGRLLRFYAVPPQLEAEPAPASALSSEPDWSPLFSEAHLDEAALRPVAPRWTPPFYADTRAAWEGSWPGRPDISVRVEAAAHRGHPTWFEVIWPWTRPERMESNAWPTAKVVRHVVFLTVVLLLLGAASFMARRNLVLGRGDRRGAFRVSLLLCGIGIVSWALGAHNVADWSAQIGLVTRGAGAVVLEAAFVWLVYLAVEPYARRLRPWTLVSWTRFLGGGFSDPVVGRDMLVGLAWAALVYYLTPIRYALPPLVGAAAPEPSFGYLDALVGPGPLLSVTLGAASESILYALGVLLLFVLVRSVLRHDALATTALIVIMLVPAALGAGEHAWLTLPTVVIWTLSWILLLLRFGLLAASVGLFVYDLLYVLPITTALGSWKAAPTLLALPMLALLCVICFRTAIGGTGLRRYLAPEPSSRRSGWYHRRHARGQPA